MQRGQAWWPYPQAMPPFGAIAARVEALGADQIVVLNGAVVATRNTEAAHAAIPKDLLLPPGSQLQQPQGFYLVKIAGFSRNQSQVDALEAAGAVLGELLNVNTYIAGISRTRWER